MIDVRDLELIGADYDRIRDYYLDRKSGNLYVRESWARRGKDGRPTFEGGAAHSELRLMQPAGEPIPHTDGFGTITQRN